MAEVLMWIGITVLVIGWIALGWQAAKRLTAKDELEKFPEKKQTMQLHRNYCWLTMMAGIIILIISLLI